MTEEVPLKYSRQEGLAPRQELATARCVVIGAGAVGRQVCLQLASMGVGALAVYDFDAVAEENLCPQAYRPGQLGLNKAEATLADCLALNPGLATELNARRFAKSDFRRFQAAFVFACVDNMEGRRLLYETAVKGGARWFGDARAAGEVVRVIGVPRPGTTDEYEKTLFRQEDAFVGSCTSKMTVFGASLAGSLLVAKFAQHLRGARQGFSDQLLNVLDDDLTVYA